MRLRSARVAGRRGNRMGRRSPLSVSALRADPAETERGSAAGGYTPPHVNVRIPWRLPSYILRQQQGDQT
ncbi:hypothetical protein MPLSOD_30184 [Mesorhizobium sp. SOD10]|nr:hypothetical protein MPLSOD_30184 [Mesorhizobium sp. SOD10]